MKTSIVNTRLLKGYEKQLYTILVARIVGAETIYAAPSIIITQFVREYQGKMREYDYQTFVATFEGPSKAVHCSLDLLEALQGMQIKLAFCIYLREFVSNTSFNSYHDKFAHEMLLQAKPNQVLVTQTIKYLLVGSRLNFVRNPTVLNISSGETLSLFSVSDTQYFSFKTEELSPLPMPNSDVFLEQVLQCIATHIADVAFGVNMLCEIMGVSERQLQRKLKALTHKSPNKLISSVRLHRAKELLQSRKYSIAEIAAQTGFSTPSYFSKCFKREFGISPSALLM